MAPPPPPQRQGTQQRPPGTLQPVAAACRLPPAPCRLARAAPPPPFPPVCVLLSVTPCPCPALPSAAAAYGKAVQVGKGFLAGCVASCGAVAITNPVGARARGWPPGLRP